MCKYLWGADHVFSRNGQGGDVHGDAAVHVESPDQEETATANYRPEEQDSRQSDPMQKSGFHFRSRKFRSD